MNAYELAAELRFVDAVDPNDFIKDAMDMLRQLQKEKDYQADRIAELEKDLHMIQRHYDQLNHDTTPQIKELSAKCIVKDCENHKHQGRFVGDICAPCYEFIATGKGKHSQAYRNAQIKELSNISDIKRTSDQSITLSFTSCRSASAFQAILKKANNG